MDNHFREKQPTGQGSAAGFCLEPRFGSLRRGEYCAPFQPEHLYRWASATAAGVLSTRGIRNPSASWQGAQSLQAPSAVGRLVGGFVGRVSRRGRVILLRVRVVLLIRGYVIRRARGSAGFRSTYRIGTLQRARPPENWAGSCKR